MIMSEDLDLFAFGNKVNIQDLNSDLDISDSKWDFIFEYLLKEAPIVYFEGFRLWVEDNDFVKNVDYLSDGILLDKNSHSVLLLKLKPSSILLNRSLLNKMWEYYEYPMLIFLKDDTQENKLIELSNQLPLAKDKITESLKEVFTAHRAGQPDVLWLERSKELTFPWRTERSPRAIEKEASKSWFEKFMNSLGFHWDIKIKRE
jgi:hypothetical protein